MLRDLAAISGRAALPFGLDSLDAYELDVQNAEAHGFTEETLRNYVHFAESRELFGALLGNVLFGPALTIVVIWAKHVLIPGLIDTDTSSSTRSPSPSTRVRLDRTRSFLTPDRNRARQALVLQ